MKWSKKQQLLLLKRTCYHKPIGKHRNKELDILIGEFKERFPELDVKKQDLINELEKYYDLNGIEALEKEDEVFVEKRKPQTKKKRNKFRSEKKTKGKLKEKVIVKDDSDDETAGEDADESISSRLAKRAQFDDIVEEPKKKKRKTDTSQQEKKKKKKRSNRSRSRRKVTITETVDNDANKSNEESSRSGKSKINDVNDRKGSTKRHTSRSRKLLESSSKEPEESSEGKGSETESDDNIGSRTRRRSLRETSKTPSINSSPVRRGRSRTPRDIGENEKNDASLKEAPKGDDIVRRLKSRSRSKARLSDKRPIAGAKVTKGTKENTAKDNKRDVDDDKKGRTAKSVRKTEDVEREEDNDNDNDNGNDDDGNDNEDDDDDDDDDEEEAKNSIASRTRRHQRSPQKSDETTARSDNRKHRGRSRK